MEPEKVKYIITKEKRKKYNNNFMTNNKDKIIEQIVCPVCRGHFTYFNKSRHNKTTRHKSFLN